jgi:hypothetical protein
MPDNDSTGPRYGVSSSLCDYILRQQLAEIRPRQIVDFGAGGGKNGRISREMLADQVRLVAVEGCPETAKMLSGQGLYDEVHESLIQAWVAKDANHYDLAIFGDVLEHLAPREIHAVLGQCLKKFKHIIVICPLHEVFQEDIYDNPLEVHQTYVTIDFFDRYNVIEKHLVKRGYWTIMNIRILSECEPKPISKRLSHFIFHNSMRALQPLGLSMPFANFIKRHVIKTKTPKP